jgi:hypothetical protein
MVLLALAPIVARLAAGALWAEALGAVPPTPGHLSSRSRRSNQWLLTLTGAQLGRLEDEIRHERQRRASSEGGGEGAPHIHEGTAPPLTEVLEYRPHEEGYLQLELRRYIRRDGSTRERGPYWYFQFHEGGKRKKLYLGKTSEPQSTLAAKRSKPLGK